MTQLTGSGADIWGSSDEFHFAYTTLSGDGTISARVVSVSNADLWTKAGVMMRAAQSANSAHASMFVSSGKGLAFQRRTTTGGTSTHTSGLNTTAPYWVRLVRSGTSVSAYVSPTGASWSLVGSDTIALGSTIDVGLALTSHRDGALASASFDNVTVTSGSAGGTLPEGWSHGDIGSVAAAGSAAYADGVFSVSGSGADIWNDRDEFHFAYRMLSGDGSITARIAALDGVDNWSKAGVMMRASLAAASRHAMMIVSSSNGLAFQRRAADGGLSTHTSGGSGNAPRWVRLERDDDQISAFTSVDGTTWAPVGTDTIAFPSTMYVGLAITSHGDGRLAAAQFDNVS